MINKLAYALLKVLHLSAVDVHMVVGWHADIGRHTGSDQRSNMEHSGVVQHMHSGSTVNAWHMQVLQTMQSRDHAGRNVLCCSRINLASR
jgi:hypothetical protein